MIRVKTCPTCGTVIAAHKRRCDACQLDRPDAAAQKNKRYDKIREPQEVSFRNSKQWRATRDYILQRDGYLCAECRSHGRFTVATEVHHLVPLWEDFLQRLNEANLVSLCHRCHTRLEPQRLK